MGSRPTGRRHVRLFAAGVLSALLLLGLQASAALAGTLTNVTWTPSNLQNQATNVTYAFSFRTATAGTIASVTLTVPNGTAGTIAVGTVYGLGAGTVALASNTITYTVTTPVSVVANIPIYLSFTGLTNRITAGPVTSTVTTRTSAPATIDSGTSNSVTFGPTPTVVTVTLLQTLTFTNDTSAFSLVVDPTGTANSMSQVVTLGVQTNASSGYTLAASHTGLSRTSPAYTIADVSSGPGTGVGTFPTTGYGTQATLTHPTDAAATMASGLSSSDWVGFPASPATFFSSTGSTGATADTFAMTIQVQVGYDVPAGSYTDTITYVATPSY